MAGRKLAATVHVDGTVYLAGATVPADVAEQITNPKAWGPEVATAADDAQTPSEPSTPASKPKGSRKGKAESKPSEPVAPAAAPADGDASAESDDEGDDLTPPPLSGAGSGAKAWLDYAVAAVAKAGLNIEFPEDVKREDIVAALDEAGIATKPKE